MPLLKRRKCSLHKASAATRLWSARAASDPGSGHPGSGPHSTQALAPTLAPTFTRTFTPPPRLTRCSRPSVLLLAPIQITFGVCAALLGQVTVAAPTPPPTHYGCTYYGTYSLQLRSARPHILRLPSRLP